MAWIKPEFEFVSLCLESPPTTTDRGLKPTRARSHSRLGRWGGFPQWNCHCLVCEPHVPVCGRDAYAIVVAIRGARGRGFS